MVEQPETISAAAATTIAAPEVDLTFPRFPELPAELRLLIWRFSLPHRVFEIRQETVPTKQDGEADVIKDLDHDAWRVRNSDLVAVLLAPPVLLSVCREARKFALQSGSWKCVGSRPRGTGRAIRLATWFDPSTDTLCFDEPVVQFVTDQFRERDGVILEPANNPAVTRVYFGSSPASPVCVSLAALVGPSGRFFVEQWKRKRGFWSGVPRYQFYHDSILMHLGRSPRVQEIFGKGAERCHTLLVDACDLAKLRQLRKLYVEESDPAFFQRRVADFLEDITNSSHGYIDQSYNDLKDLWLKGHDDIPSSALVLSEDQINVQMRSLLEPGAVLNTVQLFDHTHPWSKERIDDMPSMELVVHFRLCITNHDKERGQILKSVETQISPGMAVPIP
ncbi:28S ribosomal protein S5, mitochondrial [Hypoxylon texense]